jgi:hypothetical protein
MKRLVASVLAIVAAAACRNDSPVSPSDAPGVSFAISDGAHGGGNTSLYFLPPMVPSPVSVDGTFDPNAHPTVSICLRNAGNTACVGSPTVFTDVKVTGNHYKVNWKSPSSAPANAVWRVSVLVGSTTLGFADVKNASTVDPNQFVKINAGQTLPIKFLIQSSLVTACTSTPCSEGTIGPTDGTVLFTDGDETIGGLHIPGQGRTFDVRIQNCPSGELAVDIPVFGSCLDILVKDANGEVVEDNENDIDNQLLIPAQVFVCNVEAAVSVLSTSQQEQVTLHRKRGGQVQALLHDVDFCPPPPSASLGNFVRALVQGDLKRAARRLVTMMAPKPLYARRLDEGAGGRTIEFSFFQFALPAEMRIEGGNNQTGPYGSTLPNQLEVLVTDLFDAPVENAKVHFTPTAGSGSVGSQPVVVLSGSDGRAKVSWTLPPSNPGHSLQVEATGFGIAAINANGPRAGVDPFLGIQDHFDGCGTGCGGSAVQLQEGKLTFTASGFSASASLLAPRTTRIRPIDLMVGPLQDKPAQPVAKAQPKAGKPLNQ